MIKLVLAFICAALLFGSAEAQDIAGQAKEAEALAGQGKFAEAIEALDVAVGALWDKAPLTVRRALWVADEPQGFGAYTPRLNNHYAAGAKMIVYSEPIGFGWRKAGDFWKTDIAVDMAVKTPDGKELFRKDGFSKFEVTSRARNREFYARLTYTLSGIPAGEYVIDTTMHDAVSGKSGTFSLPFVVE